MTEQSRVASPPQPVVGIPAPAPAGPRVGSRTPSVLVALGIALGGLLFLCVLGYLILGLGASGVAVAAVAALIPLVIVLLSIRWIDRWEPEPRAALLFALLWGAGVSVVVALAVDLGVQVGAYFTGGEPNDVLQAVVQAPLVEEIAKGLGVLLVLLAGRRWFDGPVDGLVYAATVAAGFAFTENVLYFATELAQGGSSIVSIFVLRGLFSPFAHVLFTACTGLALGVASRRTGKAGALGYFVIGLVPAIFLHALWNGALSVVTDVVAYYFAIQVPIFLGFVAIVVILRAHERRLTRARLEEYAAVGWFNPTEVAFVSTYAGRRTAMAWARANSRPGVDRARAMRAFIRDATRLAHARQRLASTRPAPGSTPDERILLDAVVRDRAALLG